MEIQKEEKCFGGWKKIDLDGQKKAGNLQHRFNSASANIRKNRVLLLWFPYVLQKTMEQKRWNFQYRFAFAGECGDDEGGVSHEFYSVKQLVDNCVSSVFH